MSTIPDKALIPGSVEGPSEGSIALQLSTVRRNKGKDKEESYKKGTGGQSAGSEGAVRQVRMSAPLSNNSGEASRRKPKEKGSAQIPPKPPLFKKTTPVKTRQAKARESAQVASITLDAKGLVDVNVMYSHISSLGAGSGINPELVSQALIEDNLQRKSQTNMVLDSYPFEGPDLSFNLDSEDESDSEMLEDL